MTDSSPDRSPDTSLVSNGSTWRALAGQARQAAGYREKSLVLSSALDEYRRLRETGTAVSAREFCDRFPDYRKSLLMLLDVEDNLGHLGAIDDPFPDVGGSFLGFEILSELGIGAIARVYLASETELGGRIVVIKVSSEGSAEANTLGRLQHPNIVQVHSVKQDAASGMTAVCMRYQGSATLTDVLDLVIRNGALPTTSQGMLDVASRMADMEVLQSGDLATSRPDPVLARGSFVDGVVHIGIQLAEALEYAHGMGVLHRDLKPSNVLLTPHGRPMLLDFNLSYDAAQDTTPLGGTLPYMAPEQIRASLRQEVAPGSPGLDPQCDVFSLGVILYELLTGKLPYGGPPEHLGPEAASLWQLNACETAPVSACALNNTIPLAVTKAIDRCLALAPTDRPAAMAELSQALRPHFHPTRRIGRWLHRHPWLCRAAVMTLLLAIFSTAGYFTLRAPWHVRQYRLASAAYQKNDFDGALELSAPIVKTHPKMIGVHLLRGLAFEGKQDYREAVVEFEQVSRVVNTAAVWDHLACCCARSGKYVDAGEYFDKAKALDENNASLYMKRAYVASKDQESLDRGREFVDRAIDIDPNLMEAYLIRGEIAARNDNVQAAISDLRRAIEISPSAYWVREFAADRLCTLAASNMAAREEMVLQLNEAVTLGLPKTALLSCSSYRRFQQLFQALPERAVEVMSPQRSLHHSIVPSFAIHLPAH